MRLTLGRALPGLRNRGEDAVRLVADRRRHLGQTDLAALLVQQMTSVKVPPTSHPMTLSDIAELRHDFYSSKLQFRYILKRTTVELSSAAGDGHVRAQRTAGCPDLDLICRLGKDALETRLQMSDLRKTCARRRPPRGRPSTSARASRG